MASKQPPKGKGKAPAAPNNLEPATSSLYDSQSRPAVAVAPREDSFTPRPRVLRSPPVVGGAISGTIEEPPYSGESSRHSHKEIPEERRSDSSHHTRSGHQFMRPEKGGSSKQSRSTRRQGSQQARFESPSRPGGKGFETPPGQGNKVSRNKFDLLAEELASERRRNLDNEARMKRIEAALSAQIASTVQTMPEDLPPSQTKP